MARTLVGTLILRLQENISKGAGAAAGALNRLGSSFDALSKRGSGFSRLATDAQKLERDLARLGSAPWGARLQSQLERLGAGAKDIERVRAEWNKLADSMNSRGLTKGAMTQEIARWRTGVLGHFTAVRLEAEKTKRSLADLWKPAAIAAGLGTGSYMTARLGRKGLAASSEYLREQFRQGMAGISPEDRGRLETKAAELSKRYPSVSLTDAMSLGRSAYPFMGGMDRGLQVLEAMTKAFVTLQSAKGVDAAIHEITGLVKGIDNLGKNEGQALGVKNTIDIINGITKAVQMEGRDLDARKLFDFARRAKVAGPQLSTAFLMGAAPALMQDMTAEGFGTALSSAYKALVIGANDSASAADIGAQSALGIRRGAQLNGKKVLNKGELLDKELYSTDPFAWVEKVLIPALQAKGIDLNNDALVTENIAKLSRNSNATGMLTRMVLQRENIRKNMEFYNRAMGIDAADDAQKKDPFVAYEGFGKSFDNLSAALGKFVMPSVVTSMNNLAAGINSIGTAIATADISKLDSYGKALASLGVAGGIGGAFAARGVISMLSAGPMLMQAAQMLQAAALAQGAKGIPGAPLVAPIASGGGIWSSVLGAGGAIAGLFGLGWLMNEGFKAKKQNPAAIGLENEAAKRREQRRAADEELVNRYRTPANPPARGGFGAIVDVAPLDDASAKAKETGALITESLNVTARPNVDTGGIAAARAEVEKLKAALGEVGSLISGIRSGTSSLNGAYSDYGVSP